LRRPFGSGRLYTILIVNDQVNEDLKTGGFSALHQR
jgi:hypothetical protein